MGIHNNLNFRYISGFIPLTPDLQIIHIFLTKYHLKNSNYNFETPGLA